MAKDNIALLKRFIADEDQALERGTSGQLWEKERGRIGPLIGRAWRHLSWRECEALYGHLMRRTRRLPQVQPSELLNLGKAYEKLDPNWDRIGLAFRFGRTPRALLPSGFVTEPKEFAARCKLLARFDGFPDANALRGRAKKFEQDAAAYAGAALDALRVCGYSETDDPDEVPDSLTYWGLVLLVALDPVKRLDLTDELASLPVFSRNEAHAASLAATLKACDG